MCISGNSFDVHPPLVFGLLLVAELDSVAITAVNLKKFGLESIKYGSYENLKDLFTKIICLFTNELGVLFTSPSFPL